MSSRKWHMVIAAALLTAAMGVALVAEAANRAGLAPLSSDEKDGLLFMREEEKLARDSYLVLYDLWGLEVFANIAGSEQSHTDSVEKLLDKYRLEDPVTDELNIGNFVNEALQALYDGLMDDGDESELAGLMVGGFIEETDITDIQAWMDLADNADIISVYESLMCGSRNHLRAFVAQIESMGVVYHAQSLTQKEVNDIVDSPIERDCGTTSSTPGKGRGW